MGLFSNTSTDLFSYTGAISYILIKILGLVLYELYERHYVNIKEMILKKKPTFFYPSEDFKMILNLLTILLVLFNIDTSVLY